LNQEPEFLADDLGVMRGLGLLFGGAMAAVFAAGMVLSEVMADPNCTEGPCAQDAVKGAAVVLVVIIGGLWLLSAYAYDADRHSERDRDSDR
jgi:hypothetical protein